MWGAKGILLTSCRELRIFLVLELFVNVFYSFTLFYVCVLLALTCVHRIHACGPWRLDEAIEFPGPGVAEGCEPPCGC